MPTCEYSQYVGRISESSCARSVHFANPPSARDLTTVVGQVVAWPTPNVMINAMDFKSVYITTSVYFGCVMLAFVQVWRRQRSYVGAELRKDAPDHLASECHIYSNNSFFSRSNEQILPRRRALWL